MTVERVLLFARLLTTPVKFNEPYTSSRISRIEEMPVQSVVISTTYVERSVFLYTSFSLLSSFVSFF